MLRRKCKMSTSVELSFPQSKQTTRCRQHCSNHNQTAATTSDPFLVFFFPKDDRVCQIPSALEAIRPLASTDEGPASVDVATSTPVTTLNSNTPNKNTRYTTRIFLDHMDQKPAAADSAQACMHCSCSAAAKVNVHCSSAELRVNEKAGSPQSCSCMQRRVAAQTIDDRADVTQHSLRVSGCILYDRYRTIDDKKSGAKLARHFSKKNL